MIYRSFLNKVFWPNLQDMDHHEGHEVHEEAENPNFYVLVFVFFVVNFFWSSPLETNSF